MCRVYLQDKKRQFDKTLPTKTAFIIYDNAVHWTDLTRWIYVWKYVVLNIPLIFCRYGVKVPPQPKVTSAYSFQNAFFYLQFADDQEAGSPMRVLRKTRRKSKFNPQKQRSKYICVPRNVKEAGNHFIWEFGRGSNLNVPTKYGYLHHYRVCEFGGDDCIHTESHVDRTMFHYRDRLLTNVNSVLKKLSDRCQLDQSLKRDLLDQQS